MMQISAQSLPNFHFKTPANHVASSIRKNHYQNANPHAPIGFGDILRWKLRTLAEKPRPITTPLPTQEPDLSLINSPTKNPEALRLTWLGHAGFLIQTAGLSLLIDVVLADHCSPLPTPSLKRLQPPPFTRETTPIPLRTSLSA